MQAAMLYSQLALCYEMSVANRHAHELIPLFKSSCCNLQSNPAMWLQKFMAHEYTCCVTSLFGWKSCCIMPCKPGGYMPHAMQARRLHVPCHASQEATCLMPCKPEGYMSHGGRPHGHMHTSWQTCQHIGFSHTAACGETQRSIAQCIGH